jgi:porin
VTHASTDLVTVIIMWAASLALADDAGPQTSIGETLSGPDSHETGQGPHGHLLGDWGGVRPDLFERGVRFDFQYISDSLANVVSDRNDRFVAWNRVRGTVDIDFGALIDQPGWYFHATALWQNGGKLGPTLGEPPPAS